MVMVAVLTAASTVIAGAAWGMRALPQDSPPVRALEFVVASHQLGSAGRRCLDQPITTYQPTDPSGNQNLDPELVDIPPEKAIFAAYTDPAAQPRIVRMSIDHKSGHAVAWVYLDQPDGEEFHIITLIAATGVQIQLRLPSRTIFICDAHLSQWIILNDEKVPIV
ncbi:MAG TPA: hypothetical protein VKU87_09165 [Thermomicrobiaceae bacterium]|nr:hypothetical protein [Thermomicrobiaceae bacterium]